MMHELTAAYYGQVEALFEPLAFMPFCAGVLAGSHSGRVFVDNLDQPRTAFMLTWGCWGYLAGDADNLSFGRALHDALWAKTLLGEEAWGLFLSCPPDGWAGQLAALCAPRRPIEFPRRHYVAHGLGYDWRANVPQGYAVRRIDRSLLDWAGSDLPDDVKGMILAIDRDADAAEKRCGFVATYEGQIAAQAMIDCVVGDVGEIGFFAQEAHRRRGLATAVSAATLEAGLGHGLSTVVWDCYEYNTGSIRIAEKLGLARERDHSMYCFHLDKARHGAMLAWHQADRGDYQQTLETCEQLLTQQAPAHELAYVAAARAWAALGVPDRAFANLKQAIDGGWTYAPDLESAEFDRLRDTAAWQAVVERVCR